MRTSAIDRRCPTCRARPGVTCVEIRGIHAISVEPHPARHDPMAALHGVLELRAAVRWANGQPESEHENMTAEEILARFRKEQDE